MIPQQPDLATILVIYVTVLVYPIGTFPPQGSVQQGSLTCEMVSLLPRKEFYTGQTESTVASLALLVRLYLHLLEVEHLIRA